MLYIILLLAFIFVFSFIICAIKVLWAILTNDKDNKPYSPW